MALINHYSYNNFAHYDIEEGKTIPNANDKITVITSFTDKGQAILSDQLENSSQNYINATENVSDSEFVKAFKPKYYADALRSVNTEYAIIMDSYDTVINTFDGITEVPSEYGKKIVYGAWHMHFPTFFNVDFNVSKENPLKYLNSGVVVGKTSDLINLYNALSDYIQERYPLSDHWLKDYEQYWIYKFLTEYGEYVQDIGIDFNEILVVNYPIKK